MMKQYFKLKFSGVLLIHIVYLMGFGCRCMNLPEWTWYHNPCDENEINYEYISHPTRQHNIFNKFIQNVIERDEDNLPLPYFEKYCPNVLNMLQILRKHPKKRILYHMLMKWAYLIDIIIRNVDLDEYHKLLPYREIKMELKLVLCEYKSSHNFKNIKRIKEFEKCLPVKPDRSAITSLDMQIRYSLPLFFTKSLQILEHATIGIN